MFDPLLPSPLVDVDERRVLFESVLRHDAAGRACWRQLDLASVQGGLAAPGYFEFESLATSTRS